MTQKKSLDFSFSGLKTYARNVFLKDPNKKKDIAKAFEVAAIETLLGKCELALKVTKRDKLFISGGVSANNFLRKEAYKLSNKLNIKIIFPKQDFCTDNGAMIAMIGSLQIENKVKDLNNSIDVKPRWPLELMN